MFWDVFLFELRYRVKRPATYLYFLIIFLLVFGAIASNNVTIGEQAGNLLRNSPAAIFRITAIMTAAGMIIISAMMSNPVLRDFEHKTNHLLFSYPLSKFSYLAGRFLGSYVFAVFVFLSIPLGIMLGSVIAPAAGWIEASRFDSFRFMAYFSPFFLLVLPNVFFVGALLFSLTSLKRKMIYSYLGSVILLVIYLGAMAKIQNLESKTLAAMLDPFGIAAFYIDTEYWTPAEINSLLIPLSNKLLINRIIWIAVGFGVLAFTYVRFKFLAVFEKDSNQKVKLKKQVIDEEVEKAGIIPRAKQLFSTSLNVKQFFSLGWLEFITTIKEVPFIGIVAAGVLLLVTNAVSIGEMYGTDAFPVTYNLLEYTRGNFALVVYIIITFYSGEIVWRERGYGINQITDSLPLPSWIFAGSKLLAMFLILVLLLTILFIVNVLTQVFHGFYDFNIPLYLTNLYTLQLPGYLAVAILAMLVQTLSSNKYVGHVVVMFYYIIFFIALGLMGVEHYMFLYPQTPGAPYSDMNGFGHFLMGVRWYQLAWIFLSAFLVILTILFWNRGINLTLSNRVKVARQQLSKPFRYALTIVIAGFILSAGYVVYNTTVLNHFFTQKQREKIVVEYEKNYKKYQNIPQPKIKAANLNVDIYPNERDVFIKGELLLKNETGFPIDSVHFVLDSDVKLTDCRIGEESELVLNDRKHSYYIVKLGKAINSGDSVKFSFGVEYISRGFTNGSGKTTVAHNGTFINSAEFIPTIGYQPSNELNDKNRRKKFDLPEKERMAQLNDSLALQRTYLGPIGDWIDFEATVSTIPTQIAIAPGYLEKEWKENGRRYFHYKMDRPILNFYSFLSAEYQVLEDKWNDIDLKVYYHKGHEYNINKMIEAMKASLEYFTANFSSFQHKELRIVEFPRYATFAQSFPTTIPYSESIGFIANLKDEDDIDYVFYVTAHEIAHQWWAHQVIGGDVQGATLMSEALAQYSALMVMEKRYGKDQMKKFLQYELDRYLRGRRSEMKKELPLNLCENQNYIHYNKGSIVMYALRDYIGEENVNKALSTYLADWAYLAPPFSKSTDFMKYIDNVTPDSLKYLLDDMFENITVYDIKAKEAKMEKLADGKYKVTLTADVQKYRADSLGFENQIALNDWIDVGVMTSKEVDGKKKQVELYLQKYKIDKANPTFEIIVDEKPETAGIDPYNKLIDRHSDNNTVKITTE
ncbi:MAG TPA: M1 family aminopeptidase [Tenuifilaceae bacterium]|nr:M1 family aminopeptidase [Tenuifilaceae bacterium]